MATRVAINGFGRIGRLVLRAAHESGRRDLEFVAINDLGSAEANAHLLKYDSVHGKFPGSVEASKAGIDLGQGPIRITSERDPAKLPWDEMKVDVVLECTGLFTSREAAEKHRQAGANKVLISAPANDVDMTVVYGINDDKLKAEHRIVSNGSCTTNCLVPVVAVLHKAIGIERGYMTTVHSFTGDQRTVDTLHSDLRRARAASEAMIPTSSGASRAVALVLPELKGKIDGTAIRVPTPNVSLIDFTFDAARKTTSEEINAAVKQAAQSNRLKDVLGINEEPLVSIDFNHDSRSAIFDVTQTAVMDERFCRVLAWYDNEWGFSNRMCDTAVAMGRLG